MPSCRFRPGRCLSPGRTPGGPAGRPCSLAQGPFRSGKGTVIPRLLRGIGGAQGGRDSGPSGVSGGSQGVSGSNRAGVRNPRCSGNSLCGAFGKKGVATPLAIDWFVLVRPVGLQDTTGPGVRTHVDTRLGIAGEQLAISQRQRWGSYPIQSELTVAAHPL